MFVAVLALALVLRPVAIEGEARCPSPEALTRALTSLVPEARVANGEHPLVVRVDDLGARWRLTVDGARRELPDGARRCEERARQAAVVVAVALEPPNVSLEEARGAMLPPPPPPLEPSEAEVRAPIEERPAPPSGPRRMLSLEVAARIDLAPAADGGTLAQGGVGLRAALGRGRLAAALGIAAVTPSTMGLAPSPVHITRIPIDLSARWIAYAGRRSDTVLDGGVAASVLLLEGALGDGGNRVDVGVRAAIAERFWWRDDMALFVAAEAAYLPRTYALVLDDGAMGRIEGHTPDLWMGVSAGWSLRWH